MISVENVAKSYKSQIALAPTTLQFDPASTTVLIGPSGCGKSTLLRIIVGLVAPDAGSVSIEGSRVTTANVEAMRHRIGYVIQDGGLFPHLTAEGNATLLAKFLKKPSGDIEKRVRELCEIVQLPREALGRFPSELSGGQRQRVGLMRALMLDPPALLLDEPLGALDPITRNELQGELKSIFARLGKTVVLVTHDMGEAAYLADRIVLMRAGKIVQQGTLADMIERPADPYVTEFIRAQRSPLPALPETAAP